jgi:hypothetical protein
MAECGYCRITTMLNNKYRRRVSHKGIERIWRKEGLKVPRNDSNKIDYGLMTDPVASSLLKCRYE